MPEVAIHCSVLEAVIGLLTLQADPASSHTACGVVVRVKVNNEFPNCVPDSTTFENGVELSVVL